MENELLFEKAAAFHGHVCGGLTIGYQAARYAQKLLGLTFSEDEEVVCVTENDACGVDAIQVMLGCSAGKGNLLFRMRGKQAFSFFNRKTGASIRLVMKDDPFLKKTNGCSREDVQKHLFETAPEELFEVKKVPFELPEVARIFDSVICDNCGEKNAENYIHLQGNR
jgi:formylmethanofuran dehydrogenase subunit E